MSDSDGRSLGASISDQEFLAWCPDGAPYLPLLDFARGLAEAAGLRVCRTERRGQSVFERNSGLIRWYLGRAAPNGQPNDAPPAAAALASLFHELGHLEQPELSRGDPAAKEGTLQQLERERDAWRRAEQCLVDRGVGADDDFWRSFRWECARTLRTHERRFWARVRQELGADQIPSSFGEDDFQERFVADGASTALFEYARTVAASESVWIWPASEPPSRFQVGHWDHPGLTIPYRAVRWDLRQYYPDDNERDVLAALSSLFHELGHSKQLPFDDYHRIGGGDLVSKRCNYEADAWSTAERLVREAGIELPPRFWSVFTDERRESLRAYGCKQRVESGG